MREPTAHAYDKRWFAPDALAEELGGGEVLHAGTWLVAVRSPRAGAGR